MAGSCVLSGAVTMITGENVKPEYEAFPDPSFKGETPGQTEVFLTKVFPPMYDVIFKEAPKSRNGTADHLPWTNYDDLNEFFWSTECFQIGWPMNLNHDSFVYLLQMMSR